MKTRIGSALCFKRSDSTGTAKFVWDQENVIEETDDADETQVVYTLEPLGYGNLISQKRGANTSYHLFDGLGSTDRLTDGSATVTDNYVYEGFGSIKASSGSTTNPYKFVGELGYYSHADLLEQLIGERWYTPQVARWLSQDPATVRADYLYGLNSPLNRRDPSGLQPIMPVDPNRARPVYLPIDFVLTYWSIIYPNVPLGNPWLAGPLGEEIGRMPGVRYMSVCVTPQQLQQLRDAAQWDLAEFGGQGQPGTPPRPGQPGQGGPGPRTGPPPGQGPPAQGNLWRLIGPPGAAGARPGAIPWHRLLDWLRRLRLGLPHPPPWLARLIPWLFLTPQGRIVLAALLAIGIGIEILTRRKTQEECDEQRDNDDAICRRLRSARDRARCFEQAAYRYAQCIAGRWEPPLIWPD